MTPVQIIPPDERDPEQEIQDAQQTMDHAHAQYQAAREHWLDLNAKAGHPITDQPARWN